MSIEHEGRRSMPQACEDCGGQVVSGLEPFQYDPAMEVTYERSDWCTNFDCPSNRALAGLHRTGVNDYICLECGEVLTTPMPQVMRHRRMHRGQPETACAYTYG